MSENVATLNKDLHLKQDEFWYGILGIWYSWTLLCGVESIRMTSQECAKNGSWTRVAVTYGGWCCTGNQPTETCFAFILIRGWLLYNIVMGVCHTATWTGHRCVCGSSCRARAHCEGQPWVWESHPEPVALFQGILLAVFSHSGSRGSVREDVNLHVQDEWWMDPIYRQGQASPITGNRVRKQSARACWRCFCNGFWWGCGGCLEEGGALVTTDHSQLCWCNCRMGCDGSSQVLLRTGFLFSWSYQFTRGIIKNKTSVSMSLATWRGTGMRKQTKAVLQMSQNEKNSISRKSLWYCFFFFKLSAARTACAFFNWRPLETFPTIKSSTPWNVADLCFHVALDFWSPLQKNNAKPTDTEGLFLSWWYPFAPRYYIIFFYKA